MICTETPEECELWVSEIKKAKGIKSVEEKDEDDETVI